MSAACEWRGYEEPEEDPELRLSVEDARDLIAMLGHLVGLVEADENGKMTQWADGQHADGKRGTRTARTREQVGR